jgi:ribonuclease BN (tRNA processing enzyme)
MPKIIFLGTSSSIPTKERDNTSFLFLYKRKIFLVDCPGAIVQKLLKVNVDFKKLKNIIITHHHPDHIYGIVSLIHTQAYLNDYLNIFTNSECIKIIKKLVKIFSLNKEHYPKINYYDVFKKNPFYSKNGLILEAIRNKHIKNSFGVKFIFGKKSLFYSSDTSFYPKMLEKIKDVKYLIHDCTASSGYFKKHPQLYKMHTCAKDLKEYLKTKSNVILIPIHFLLLRKNEEKKIKQELEALKNLILIKDFQTLIL